MNISDEALRAAVAVTSRATIILQPDNEETLARAVIEAAGPYLKAEALEALAADMRSSMEIPQRIYIARYIRKWAARQCAEVGE